MDESFRYFPIASHIAKIHTHTPWAGVKMQQDLWLHAITSSGHLTRGSAWDMLPRYLNQPNKRLNSLCDLSLATLVVMCMKYPHGASCALERRHLGGMDTTQPSHQGRSRYSTRRSPTVLVHHVGCYPICCWLPRYVLRSSLTMPTMCALAIMETRAVVAG